MYAVPESVDAGLLVLGLVDYQGRNGASFMTTASKGVNMLPRRMRHDANQETLSTGYLAAVISKEKKLLKMTKGSTDDRSCI
jgi:hypothetical protein